MSSDVVLTAALRNNLLSLQNTQSLIDKTQLRLATGLRVNSALDGPANFFAAQALDNRASDLSRLLDSISQSIRTIEEADIGVTALTSLVEQAQSIASSARDELAASEGEARIVGTVDLSTGFDDLVADTSITAGDVLVITTTDDSGTQISETVAISAGDTAYTLAARITDQFADNENGEISAEITDDGFFAIQSSDGRSFKLTTTAANELSAADLDALGIGDFFAAENRSAGAGTNLQSATVVAGNTITSVSLFEAAGDLAEAGDLIGAGYIDSEGNTVLSALTAGSFQVTVDNNGTAVTSTAVSQAGTFQDFVDSINQDANLNQLIEANFDSATGTLSITSLSDSVRNLTFLAIADTTDTVNLGFGDPSGNLDPITNNGGAVDDTVFRFNNSTEALDSLANDYNVIRDQIDTLVNDASYRGVNLLNGDNLTTFFNENNTSSLITEGAIFTANGLGLTEASFRSSTEIELTETQARSALNVVRSFGSTLANNLSIIQTRQSFTESTIVTLTAGADDLTVADQNEEGANLLALQTRQALGITSLSLASQSQQAVLQLF
ncbi:MAG: flagellin [Alphaproteobacteria bacterium]|nr:flagellin [Alphaproteobacteria bacterium]